MKNKENKFNGSLDIEDFSNLEEIDFEDQRELTNLRISNCPQLNKINCGEIGRLESLDIVDCPNVKEIYANDCHRLKKIDTSQLPELEIFDLNHSTISFDLNNNHQLRELYISANGFGKESRYINSNLFNHLTKLEKLTINGFKLTSLDTSNFPNLIELRCGSNKLSRLDLSKNKKLTNLYCPWNKIVSLNLSECSDLVEIFCNYNNLTSLDLNNNSSLEKIDISYNKIQSCNFLSALPNPRKVIELEVNNNNFQPADLGVFRKFVNLKILKVGNRKHMEETEIARGIYNRFYGSLEPLKDMRELEELNIDNTNIDSGLEYLPNIWPCNFDHSPVNISGSRVAIINEQLRPFNFSLKSWKDDYWKKKGDFKNESWIHNPRDKNKVRDLDLLEAKLDGNYEVENLPNLRFLTVAQNKLIGLTVKNCPSLRRLIASHNNLIFLKIENCDSLETIYASGNPNLKNLDFSHLKNLKSLSCDDEQSQKLNTRIEVPPKN